jgi:hypothetical protein
MRVCPIRGQFKLNCVGGDSGSRKCKRGYGNACGELWQSPHFAGAWSVESGGRFFAGAVWQESEFSHRENIFVFNVLCKEIV